MGDLFARVTMKWIVVLLTVILILGIALGLVVGELTDDIVYREF
jgi:large-conductance mechanosensitive channel